MKRLPVLSLVPLAAAVLGLAGCSDAPLAPALPAAPSLDAAADTAGRHVVLFQERSIPADFAARVAALGGTVEEAYGPLGVATVLGLTDEAAASLVGSGGVLRADPDVTVSLDALPHEPGAEDVSVAEVLEASGDPAEAAYFPRQWHLRQIGADRAWAAGHRGSPGVKVAILDTGLGYTHADLVGRVDLSLSRSFVPSDDALVEAYFPGAHPVADLRYHGTHVGATIASNGIAAAGVTSGVTLIGVKVLGVNGSGSFSGILAGITYAADVGADVINMSLGATFHKRIAGGYEEVLNRAVAYAKERGATVVVSAGNSNEDLDQNEDRYAAFCDASTALCVSATGPTAQAGVNGPWENPDAKAAYSNYGRSAISFAAPGGNGASRVTAACTPFSLVVPVCRRGTGYVLMINGTSMASPHVAALAALLVERHGRKPDAVQEAIKKSADDLGEPGNDPVYGKGRINVARALGM